MLLLHKTFQVKHKKLCQGHTQMGPLSPRHLSQGGCWELTASSQQKRQITNLIESIQNSIEKKITFSSASPPLLFLSLLLKIDIFKNIFSNNVFLTETSLYINPRSILIVQVKAVRLSKIAECRCLRRIISEIKYQQHV